MAGNHSGASTNSSLYSRTGAWAQGGKLRTGRGSCSPQLRYAVLCLPLWLLCFRAATRAAGRWCWRACEATGARAPPRGGQAFLWPRMRAGLPAPRISLPRQRSSTPCRVRTGRAPQPRARPWRSRDYRLRPRWVEGRIRIHPRGWRVESRHLLDRRDHRGNRYCMHTHVNAHMSSPSPSPRTRAERHSCRKAPAMLAGREHCPSITSC